MATRDDSARFSRSALCFGLLALAAPTVVACGSDSAEGDGQGGTGAAGSSVGGTTAAGAGNPTAGGGTASQAGSSAFEHAPCADVERVGRFSISLIPESDLATASSQLTGGVYDGVDPSKIWQDLETAGDCVLQIGPASACSPQCGASEVCDGNACIASPELIGVGKVTVTGMTSPLSIDPLPNRNDYYAPISGGFPPFESGAPLTLTAAGAERPGFSLEARGVSLLESPTETLAIEAGQPLEITWTPESEAFGAHVLITIDIAHHGGISAQIVCDVADSGSATVQASLLAALMERGVAGFPSVQLTRLTAGSVEGDTGCVELAVSAGITRALTVPGVTSCDCASGEPCAQCPDGQTCQTDLTCQ